MDAELPAGCGHYPKKQPGGHYQFRTFRTGTAPARFDAAKIDGSRIVVRTCEEGTPFVTLDGVERKLTANDLMICSATKPMCIAGVYGGLDSGVSDTTTDVFIESAYFNPVWVRKTAKRFGLNTDSSFRFERGVDPDIQVYALKRAALLDEGAGWRRDRLRNYGYLLRSYRKVQSGTRYKACQSSDRQRDSCRYDPHDSRCARH